MKEFCSINDQLNDLDHSINISNESLRISIHNVNVEFGPNSAFVDDGKVRPVFYYEYRLMDYGCPY